MELLVLLFSCFSVIPYVRSQFPNLPIPNIPAPGIPFPNISSPEFPFPNISSYLQIPDIKFENYNPTELVENLPGYGKSWMYIPDGNGIPIIAKLEFDTLPRLYKSTEDYVTFHLYTRSNPNDSQVLEFGNINTINESNIDFSKPTKIAVHGWGSNYKSDTLQIMKDNFLTTNDYNVILVDWKEIAGNIIYPVAAMETVQVGDFVSGMIDYLIQNGARLEDFHVIGHSLGGHVSGRAGHSLKSGKLERITGLDPALPGFEIVAPYEYKLDKSDAKFVDVIHTCGGILGYYSNLGHIDFYPNGGTPSQPGCFGLPQIIEACSHGRSWQYFAESILHPDDFMGTSCSSWGDYKKGKCENNTQMPMGINTPQTARGIYYLKTNNRSPFTGISLSDFLEQLQNETVSGFVEKSEEEIVGGFNTFINNTETGIKDGVAKLIPNIG